MTDKLDPVLQEHLERADALHDASQRIDVLVSLTRPPDDAVLADLAERGLDVRSVAGDILTGAVALAAVTTVAESDAVVSIDAGGRLGPESSDPASPVDSPASDAVESDSFDTPTG